MAEVDSVVSDAVMVVPVRVVVAVEVTVVVVVVGSAKVNSDIRKW